MSPFFLSQLLAGCAFVCGLTSYQLKTRRSVLLCLTLLTAFNSGHFLMLGRMGPAALMILTGSRYLTAIYSTRRSVMVIFLLLSIVTGVLTYRAPLNLVALTAVLIGTYGSFQKSDRRLRVCFMFGNSTWLLHNVIAGSPVASVMEASFLASNVFSYYRLYGRKGGEGSLVQAQSE